MLRVHIHCNPTSIMLRSVIAVLLASILAAGGTAFGQSSAQDEPLRIIAFGAHPDDCELDAGGVAALWAEEGHEVKFVSMTNGDVGHFRMAGGPLARRRQAEVQECADRFGIETEVLDIHDGELMPTLENRRKVVRLIREWKADIVLFHRPYDYHPDHRYVGELVQDASVMVMAKNFEPLTPVLEDNPIFMYMHDGFDHPYPLEPTIVVGFDEVAEKKWDCIEAMPSQFADAGSWQAATNPNVPEDPEERREYLLDGVKDRFASLADEYRDRLVELYGQEKGNAIEYAEVFQICQYGSSASVEELKELFPTFD